MKRKLSPLKLSLAAIFSVTAICQAQTDTWTGGGGDANWMTGGNWSPSAPNPGDNLVFDGSKQTTPNNNLSVDTLIGGIKFAPTAVNFTLVGNEIYITGVVENGATNQLQTISLPLVLTNAVTFNTWSNDLNGGASDDIWLTGNVSGPGSLVKMGAGTLTVSNNTYSGGTTISNGTMNVFNDHGNYTLAGGALLLNYGSWWDGPTFAFTADSSLGVNSGSSSYNSYYRYDFSGNVGSPGFKWTVIGTGRFQILDSSGRVLAGSVEITAPAILSDYNNLGPNTTISGLGTNLITVDYGAALRKNEGGVVLNPIVLNGGTGPDNRGALVADEELFQGAPQTITATFSNTITLNDDSSFGVQYGSMAIPGNIIGSGGLVKIGPNLLNLSGSNSYVGDTTIFAGTLQIGSSNAIPATNWLVLNGVSTLDLNGTNASVGGYFYDDGSGNGTVDNTSANAASLSLSGGAGFVGKIKNSGGGPLSIINVSDLSQFLGANSYTGANQVLGGTLEINIPTGTATGGLVRVADNATLILHKTTPGSSLKASGATIGTSGATALRIDLGNYGNPSVPIINATNGTGLLAANGTLTISFQNPANLIVGQFPIIKYTSRSGTGNFMLDKSLSDVGITAQIITNTSAGNNYIGLKITSLPMTTWKGYVNNNWDYKTTNWFFGATKTNYQDGMTLLFDDTSLTNNVNLTNNASPGSAISPDSILVNTTNTYAFFGTSPLSGGSLTKNGSGTLILDVASYSSTIIIGGTLQVGNNDSNGNMSGPIDNEGILSFNLTNNYTVTDVISGVGSVVKNNTNTVTLSAANSYSGGTMVNQGILKLGNNASLGVPAGSVAATVTNGASLDLNGRQITGAGYVVINGNGLNANIGALQTTTGGYIGIGTQVGVKYLRLAGNASIGDNTGDFVLGTDGNVNGQGGTCSIDGQSNVLTKIGSSGLYLEATNLTALSQFTIAAGWVLWCNTAKTPIGTSCPIVISNNAWMDAWDNYANSGITLANPFTIGLGGGQLWNTRGMFYGHACYNTFSGAFTLNSNLSLLNTATFGGGPNDVATSGTMTFSGPISGAGGISCTNGSLYSANSTFSINTVILSGTNSYTGATVVNLGVLQLSTIQQGGGPCFVYDNSTLDVPAQTGYGTAPMSSLMLGSANGATLSLSRLTSLSASTAPITATNLTVLGTNSILLPALAYDNAPGEYPLIKYMTAPSGYGTTGIFVVGRGMPGYITNDTAQTQIALVIPGGSPVTWVGNKNNAWDINSTSNWLYQSSSTTYHQTLGPGDAVLFNDSSTVTSVNIAAPVSPGLIIVSNNVNFYTFTNGAIAGTGRLLKTGTNILLLNNGTNIFSGGTSINGGTVMLGNSGSLNSSGTVTVSGNGTLDFNNQNPTALAVTISGTGLNGLGTLVNNNPANNTYGPGSVTLAGNATIGGLFRWDFRTGVSLNSPTNAYALTKVGAGYTGLYNTAVSSNLGDIYILAGTLSYQANTTGLGNPTNNLYIGGNGTLGFNQAKVPLNKSIVCSNGASIQCESGNAFGQNVIAGPVNLVSGTTTILGNYYNGIYFSNTISGPGSLALQFQSYVYLAASNTFSGTLTVPNCNSGLGTRVSLIGNGSISQAQNIYLQGIAAGQAAAAYLDVSGRVDGTLTLSPNQTLRGDNGSHVNGSVVAVQGSMIAPGGDDNPDCQYMSITNNLTINGGLFSFDVLATNNDQIRVDGAFNEASGIIRVIYSSLPVGRYHLVTFGSKTGSAANLILVLNGLQYRDATLDDTVSNTLDLVISSTAVVSPNTLVWAGDGINNYWDQVSPNWINSSCAGVFKYGDNVSFTDPATNPVANLVGTLSPATITVASTANYTFAGTGSITGNASLTKTNTGTLRINNANFFSNGTLINGGTVVLGDSGALWNNSNSVVTITNGGTLDLANFNPNATVINLSGAGVAGNGALVANYSGGAQTYGPSVINLTGSATIGGSNRWDLRGGSVQLNCPTNTYTLTKVGSGFTALVGATVSTNLGDITILGGTLGYQTSTTGLGNPTKTIYLASGTTLELYASTIPLNKNIVCTNANFLADSGNALGQNVIAGPVTLVNGTNLITGNYFKGIYFSNTISGPGWLNLQFQTYAYLAASNTYTGRTKVSFCNWSIDGLGTRLSLIGNGSISHSFLIFMEGIVPDQAYPGYIDVSGRVDGTLTLAAGQTLRGDNGSFVRGNVVASYGSTITPGGAGNIQYMIVSNNLTFASGSTNYMDVNAQFATNDLIIVSGTNNYGGTLQIQTNGNLALAVSNTFKLFSAASYTGNFASIIDSSGAIWSFNPTNGVAMVIGLPSTVNTNPATLNFQAMFSSAVLHFTWAPDHLGWQLYTNSVGLTSTNSWYPVSGSATVTNLPINVNPANPNVFFQLRYP